MPDSTFILIYRRINEYDIWWNTGRKTIDISAGLYIMQNTGCWGEINGSRFNPRKKPDPDQFLPGSILLTNTFFFQHKSQYD